MTINEIKKWAKEQGYIITKSKNAENESVIYEWFKIDDESIRGVELSVSKVAKAVFNHITNNQWTDYQIEYKNDQDDDFTIENYGI